MDAITTVLSSCVPSHVPQILFPWRHVLSLVISALPPLFHRNPCAFEGLGVLDVLLELSTAHSLIHIGLTSWVSALIAIYCNHPLKLQFKSCNSSALPPQWLVMSPAWNTYPALVLIPLYIFFHIHCSVRHSICWLLDKWNRIWSEHFRIYSFSAFTGLCFFGLWTDSSFPEHPTRNSYLKRLSSSWSPRTPFPVNPLFLALILQFSCSSCPWQYLGQQCHRYFPLCEGQFQVSFTWLKTTCWIK